MILAILGTTWSKDHLRILLDLCASINKQSIEKLISSLRPEFLAVWKWDLK